ncbi:hypothetical protein EON63_14750 [archaeon]|nr:MAG: hypothetical protein EON63_14750 [archaeon]
MTYDGDAPPPHTLPHPNPHSPPPRYNDTYKRLSELKQSGVLQQSAEVILSKLAQDVKELNDRYGV